MTRLDLLQLKVDLGGWSAAEGGNKKPPPTTLIGRDLSPSPNRLDNGGRDGRFYAPLIGADKMATHWCKGGGRWSGFGSMHRK